MDPRQNNLKLFGLEFSMVDLARYGVTLPLNAEALLEINHIAVMLHQQQLPELLDKYKDSIDKLAFYAYTACSYGDISDEQFATVLEVRAIKQLNPVDFLIERINQDTFDNPKSAIRKYIVDVYENEDTKNRIYLNFLPTLEAKPYRDAYSFRFSFRQTDFTRQSLFNEYFLLGKELKAARFKLPQFSGRSYPDKTFTDYPSSDLDDSSSSDIDASSDSDDIQNDLYEITWLSAGARDALCQTVYSSNAKKVFFRHGIGIDRPEINEGLKRGGRYSSVSFPGVQDATFFHNLSTPTFFLTVHDEFHRQMISSMPNPVYDAILLLITLLREKTKREWSPEIWRLVDMDFHQRNLKIGVATTNLTNEDLSKQFFKFISGQCTDYTFVGVFLPTPYCDTTWLMLIDLIRNEEAWRKFGIESQYLPENFQKMALFVKEKLPGIEKATSDLSDAEKVLKLKCAFLKTPYPEGAEIQFSKRMKGQPNPTEVLANKKPILHSKKWLMDIENVRFKLLDAKYDNIVPLLDSLVEKLDDKAEELKTTVLNYIEAETNNYFIKDYINTRLLLIILSNVEKNEIDEPLIKQAMEQIEAFSERSKNRYISSYEFIATLAKEKKFHLLSISYLTQLASLPDDIFDLAAEFPISLPNFLEGMQTLGLQASNFTSVMTRNVFINFSKFFDKDGISDSEEEKRQVFQRRLTGMAIEDMVFFITIWERIFKCCASPADVDYIFTLNRKTVTLLAELNEPINSIISKSNIDLKTLLGQYGELFGPAFYTRKLISVLHKLIENDLISLKEIFLLDKDERSTLLVILSRFRKLKDAKFICRTLGIGFLSLTSMNKELEDLLFENKEYVRQLLEKNPINANQFMEFLKGLKNTVPRSGFRLALEKIANNIGYNSKLGPQELLNQYTDKKPSYAWSLSEYSVFADDKMEQPTAKPPSKARKPPT